MKKTWTVKKFDDMLAWFNLISIRVGANACKEQEFLLIYRNVISQFRELCQMFTDLSHFKQTHFLHL